jgi:hypothetical protein
MVLLDSTPKAPTCTDIVQSTAVADVIPRMSRGQRPCRRCLESGSGTDSIAPWGAVARVEANQKARSPGWKARALLTLKPWAASTSR